MSESSNNKVSFNADTLFNQKSQRRPDVRRIRRRGRNNNTQPPISQQHTLTTTTNTKKAVDIDIPNSLEFLRMNNNNNNAAMSRKRSHSTMINNDICRMKNARGMNLGLKMLPGSITGTTNVSGRGGEEQQSNISNYQQQEEKEQQVDGELGDVLLKSIPVEEKEKGIEEGNDNTIEIDATAVQKEDQESSSKPAAATTKRTAARSIGNVMELFDNFNDIEEVLDLTGLDDDDDTAAATAVGNKSMESKTAEKKDTAGMPKDDNEGGEATSPARENNDTVLFVGIGDMIVDDDDDSEDGDNDNQLFTQPPEYGEAGSPKALKRGRKGRKARPKKNQIDEQQVVESQVSLPLTRTAASEKSPRRKHSLDNDHEVEEDVDFDPQSQIPLPIRRVSKKSMLYQESQIPLPAKKKKSPLPTKKSKRWRKNMQEEETVPRSLRKQPPEILGQMDVSDDDTDVILVLTRENIARRPKRKRVSNERQVAAGEEEEIEMSQVPINIKKQSTRRKSHLKSKPKVVCISDASSDEWMRIKPKDTVVKSKKSRSSLLGDSLERPPARDTKYMDSDDDSDDDQSQSPGEGSQEIPRNAISSSGSNKQPSTSQQQTTTTTNTKKAVDITSKYYFPPWMMPVRKQSSSNMSAPVVVAEEGISFESSHDMDSPLQQSSDDDTQQSEKSMSTSDEEEEQLLQEQEEEEKEKEEREEKQRESKQRAAAEKKKPTLVKKKHKYKFTTWTAKDKKEITRHQNSLAAGRKVCEVKCVKKFKEKKRICECGAITVAVRNYRDKFRATCPCCEKSHWDWEEVDQLDTESDIEQAWKKRTR